jgi:hypothetical protein
MECGSTCGPCSNGVEVFKKRDRTIRISLFNTGDLTGAKVWFSVKESTSDLDAAALITKKSANNGGSDAQAKVVGYEQDAETGCWAAIIEVYIVPDDTINMNQGSYVYDVVIQTAAGRKLQAVKPAAFSLLQPGTLT